MASLASHESDDPPPTALDDALRAIPDQPLPDDLLASCLATVPGPGGARPGLPAVGRSRRRVGPPPH